MRFLRGSKDKADPVRELFDDHYYRSTYADVADSRFDAYLHFMHYGWREGRNPSPTFNTLYYRDKYLRGLCHNPLLHYAVEGKALTLATAPLDEDDFIDVQRAVSLDYFSELDYRAGCGYTGEDALTFYLKWGWKGCTPPSFFFDPNGYVQANRYVAALEVSPFYHYASQLRLLGQTAPFCADVLFGAPPETLIERFSPSSYVLKAPLVTELERMSPSIRATMEPIWSVGRVTGRPLSVYNFKDVYVAAEGLVFTRDGQLIDVTRTHHADSEIGDMALAVRTAAKTKPAEFIEKGILVESRGAQNYGHFILEMLPRAWYARAHLKLDWPAIIRGGNSPMQTVSRQALRCVGYAPNEVIAIGPDPVFVRDLIFIDGLAIPGLYISEVALECFDEVMRHTPAAATERVYAPRGRGVIRDFENEAAVAAAFATLGFERTPTATMSFEDQVALFQGAREIVGVTGAALTNILFCRAGTRVTVFSPSSAVEVLFWGIAERRGLVYHDVRCLEVGARQGLLPWDRSIRVATSDLLRIAG